MASSTAPRKIGFFSPLPPAATGVADYSAALLRALRESGAAGGMSVEADAADAPVALYHVGNNQLHREIYQRALAQPSVAVLHDAVLQHFFLGTLDETHYNDEFVYNYGEWMRGLADDLWRNRARSASDPRYFDYPMLKRIATTSRVVIVHNPAAASVVARHAPSAQVVEIPHLFVPPELPSENDVQDLRRQLGLGPRTLLAGVFGHLRESKRLPVLIRSVHRATSAGADVKLLVAGTFASSDLERGLTSVLHDPHVLRVGYLPERDFWRYAAATDLCVNLRYPTAAETSGIAIRMMGIGKPVIFTAGEEIARIPENACLRVEAVADEEEMLAGYIVWLASEREVGSQIGRRAAAHIAEHHAPHIVAKRYWEVIKSLPPNGTL